MVERIPHKLNVQGDFYVEDGCCLSCGIPYSEAPELFIWDEAESHCYVCRQPQNEAEIDKTISVMKQVAQMTIREILSPDCTPLHLGALDRFFLGAFAI